MTETDLEALIAVVAQCLSAYENVERRVTRLERRLAEYESTSHDPSLMTGGVREAESDRPQPRVKQYIEQLEPSDATATPVDLVTEALRADGYDDAEIEYELARLRRHGEIYAPDDDHVKVV